MGTIRIEYVPISMYGLGYLGFDHLQLTYQDETDVFGQQDSWYVIEGVVDGSTATGTLGAVGGDATTTLSQANGARRDELVDLIGTPEDRGSRIVTQSPQAFTLWAEMAVYADQIDAQKFPYIAAALPYSARPTVNSTSLVTSVLWSVGFDIDQVKPYGVGYLPGSSTLLGTIAPDDMTASASFNQILTGAGDDKLRGSSEDGLLSPDKLYGGEGKDILYWSTGYNYLHGGQPGMAYTDDGFDIVNYSGAGIVTIQANVAAVEHKVADYTATFGTTVDEIFSVEGIIWDSRTDQIVAGEGFNLIENPMVLELETETGPIGDSLDLSSAADSLLVNVADTYVSVQTEANAGQDAGFWTTSLEWLITSAKNDCVYAGPDMRGVELGAGNDLIDARLTTAYSAQSPNGYDIEINAGAGNDTIVANSGFTLAVGGEGADRFVLSALGEAGVHGEFIIDDATAEDSLFIPYDLFKPERGDFDGSQLFQLIGAPFKITADSPESWFFWGATSTTDQVHGYIDFTGRIRYAMDGADLLIRVETGEVIERRAEPTPDNPNPPTRYINGIDTDTETVIRVTDWHEGDLGITFPILWEASKTDPRGYYYYPGLMDVMHQQTADNLFVDALDARPEGYVPQEIAAIATTSATTATTTSLMASMSLAEQSSPASAGDRVTIEGGAGGDTLTSALTDYYRINGYAGSDNLTGGLGGDVLDGGAGADAMRGGRGNDVYYVDDASDTVVELAAEGFDKVYASIDYVLPDNVEHVTLLGSATTATGNALRNRLVGNDTNNVFIAGGGDDVIAGNLGDDRLIGGEGSDLYVYELGDGRDAIADGGTGLSDTDVLVLIGNIGADDISLIRTPSAAQDLVLVFADGGRITIEDYFAANTIESIDFSAGDDWTTADIQAAAAAAEVTDNFDPVARDDRLSVTVAGSATISRASLLANDSDDPAQTLSITALSAPTNATVLLNAAGDIVLTPLAGTTPQFASFDYEISDGNGGSATAHVDVVLHYPPPNSVPQIVSATLSAVSEDTSAAGALVATDADGDTLTYAIRDDAGPAKGSVSLATDGTFLYAPNANANGPDSFTLTVSDGHGGTAEHAFDFSIAAINDAPVVTQASLAPVTAGQTATGSVTASDIDGDLLSFTVKNGAGPSKGSLVIAADGTFAYTANPGTSGAETFTIAVDDGHGGTTEQLFAFDISPAATGHAPIAADNGGYLIKPGQTLRITSAQILDNDTDVDGDALALASVGNAVGGTVTLDDAGNITFTASSTFTGTGSFEYQVSDGHGGIDSAVVSIGIALANDPVRKTGTIFRDTLVATSKSDILTGKFSADTFVFAPNGGHDTITDFSTGWWEWINRDKIDVRGFGFESFDNLMDHAYQDGADTLLVLDGNSSVRLSKIDVGDLTVDHFRI